MAYQITSGTVAKPQRVVIYGPEGIGKTTLAAQFPSPLFIDTEGGSGHLDVRRLPSPDSWQMLVDEVTWVRDFPAECGGTLVVDTADWAEALCAKHICSKAGKDGIEDFGYGKGYTYVKEEFGRLLNLLSECVERGLNVVVTAHAQIVKFEQPDEAGAYDRWEMKLSRRQVAPLLKEWADAVLFCNYKTVVIKETDKDGKVTKARATGGRNRTIFATHAATWDAKNRWGLPDEVPMEWAQIAPYVPVPRLPSPAAQAPAGEPDVPFDAEPTREEREARAGLEAVASVAKASEPMPEGGGWVGHLLPLMQLMAADGISEDQVCEAVWRKGYATRGQRLASYPKETVEWVVSVWDKMRDFIRNGYK